MRMGGFPNLAINTFNQPIDSFNQEFLLKHREEIKNKMMEFWHQSGNYAKEAISFLEGIITLCNKFENY
jgi:hypothetical protein